MTHPAHDNSNDLDQVSLEELMECFVLESDEDKREYLKSQWIERVIGDMVALRVREGMSQRELGMRIGKSQPSVARLEAGSDMKLSVLWDYYAALGRTVKIDVAAESLEDCLSGLHRYITCGRSATTRIPRFTHFLEERAFLQKGAPAEREETPVRREPAEAKGEAGTNASGKAMAAA